MAELQIVDEAKPEKEQLSLATLIEFIGQANITDEFEEHELTKIGMQVKEDYRAAVDSMDEWSKLTKKGLELVKPATEGRSEPWTGASNFKSSALQQAAYRFGERASTELLRPKDLVKAEVIGEDPQEQKKEKAERVANYMSYQINHEIREWRDEQRSLLYRLPNMGTIFKKTFYDPLKERQVSDLIQYPSFAVHQSTSSMEELRDFTHILEIRKNEIYSMQAAGLWRDCKLGLTDDEEADSEAGQHHDTTNTFLEQQCFYDLDGDGYEEPYTITVHESSGKVVRILPRFRKEDILVTDGDKSVTVDQIWGELEDEYGPIDNADGTQKEGLFDTSKKRDIIKIAPSSNLTAYRFLPSADGTFLGVGYYQLMSSLVEAINTGTNQLFDAGTQANLQGGRLAKGVKQKMGDARFKPGEYKATNIPAADLQQGILPLNFKEPSQTLLALVGELNGALKELSASVDLGEILGTNVAASTVLMMIEETQSSTTSLMGEQARSMGKEFQVMYRLNAIYADPEEYQVVLGDPQANYESDFSAGDLEISPTANPEMSNKTMRIQQSQIMNEQFDRLLSVGADGRAIMERFLEDIGVTDMEGILPPVSQEFEQQRMAESQAAQQASEAQSRFFSAQADALDANTERTKVEAQVKIQELPAKMKKLEADTILALEKAESEQAENQITMYTAQLAQVREMADTIGALDGVQAGRMPQQPGEKARDPRLPAPTQATRKFNYNPMTRQLDPAGDR